MDNRARIEAYFNACSVGSAADISSHFTRDAIVFDTNHAPVKGADTIGEFWAKIRRRWSDARWYLDSCVSEGNAAAIEWTMTGSDEGRAFAVSGSEHYHFRDTKIAEIRQYWTYDPQQLDSRLQGFDYASSGVHQRD